MSDKVVVETIYGGQSKYEIVKEYNRIWGGPKFYIRKDGRPHRGPFSTLANAVEAARKDG